MATRRAEPAQAPPRRIEYVALGDVRRADRNAKAHDIAWIRSLIERFGFVGSAVHDGRTGKIVAGHGRLESLEEMAAAGQGPPDGIALGPDGDVWMMPVEYGWSSRSDAEAEALGIALNEATTRGGWDERALAGMLRDLDRVDADLRRIAGWDDAGFDTLVALFDVGAEHDELGETDSRSDEDILDDTDRAAWPVIRAQVSPDMYVRWGKVPGDDDAGRVAHLLEQAGL